MEVFSICNALLLFLLATKNYGAFALLKAVLHMTNSMAGPKILWKSI